MRAAKALSFLTSGYRKDPKKVVNSAIFEYSGSKMVIVKGIEFYSLCEHHILPFYGEISIGYVPGEGMVGLSKVARIVDVFARRLQVQERLTREVCDVLYKELGAKGVIVYCEADHMCMKMRGVEKRTAQPRQLSIVACLMMLPCARSSLACCRGIKNDMRNNLHIKILGPLGRKN